MGVLVDRFEEHEGVFPEPAMMCPQLKFFQVLYAVLRSTLIDPCLLLVATIIKYVSGVRLISCIMPHARSSEMQTFARKTDDASLHCTAISIMSVLCSSTTKCHGL